MKLLNPRLNVIRQRLLLRNRIADRFIIHIGDVSDISKGDLKQFQQPNNGILYDVGAKISDVCRTIDGRPATISSEVFPFFALNCFLGTALSIKQSELHANTSVGKCSFSTEVLARENIRFQRFFRTSSSLLIMAPTAQKYNFIIAYAVHQTMLLIDAPRVGVDLAL